MYRHVLILLLGILLFGAVQPAQAHASLVRSEPAANGRVSDSPSEIRLYFTEPLEPQFSHIELRDTQGTRLDLPPAQPDPEDGSQLVLNPGELPEGVYTVAWRVVSRTDGHLTQGSFPFIIGQAAAVPQASDAPVTDDVLFISVVVRWFNLLSLAVLVGGVAFLVLVWHPTGMEQYAAAVAPHVLQRMKRFIWVGWCCVGLASAAVLLLQAATASGFTRPLEFNLIAQIVLDTRFGGLWLLRIGLWALLAVLLRLRAFSRIALALLVVCGLLLTQSLFSHASGAPDSVPVVIGDWLHLAAMSLWVGGLVQLAVVIGPVRQSPADLSRIVAHFSNMMRAAIAMLVLTGTYAAWLHVGTLEGLVTTVYGQALLAKLILLLPLLGIGGVNLLFTTRRLRSGGPIWTTRLRYLVAAEIVLTVLILAAVGVMTAAAPARTTVTARKAVPPRPADNTFFEMAVDDGMMIHFTVTPGLVGENTFLVDLLDENTGLMIDDASLIRLRFDHEDGSLGESELRPSHTGDGHYSVSGSNLSLPGAWRVRMTIQRPGQFDTVIDFAPEIGAPAVVDQPAPDPSPDVTSRSTALIITGVAVVVLSMLLWIIRPSTSPRSHVGLLIVSMACGLVMAGSGLSLLSPVDAQEAIKPTFTETAPVNFAVTSAVRQPWLITQNGAIWRPGPADRWQRVELAARANALYLENASSVWVAADQGLFRLQDDVWEQVGSLPTSAVMLTHGFAFGLAEGGILRAAVGGLEDDQRLLESPGPGAAASQLEMLGNHSHILLHGQQLYLTGSLGLGWQPVDAPQGIDHIAIDADGSLLAAAESALLRWQWSGGTWTTVANLPAGLKVDDLVYFQDSVYIVAGGQVLRLVNGNWVSINLANPGYITHAAFQYPQTLWLLDSLKSRLYFTDADGLWNSLDIVLDQQ